MTLTGEELTKAQLFADIVHDAYSGNGEAIYILGEMNIELKRREPTDPTFKDYLNRWRQNRMGSRKAQLITNTGEVATYRLSDGAVITLSLDEGANSILVTDSAGGTIGNMDVTVIENEHGPDTHRLRNMYLDRQGDRYKRMGIGRACVEHYNAYYDVVLTAAQVGEDPGDGGHLTADAPGFIAAMRREGLVT